MNRSKFLTLGMLCFSITSCAGTYVSREGLDKASYGKKPENYQALIKGYMQQVLIDPESVQYRDWTTPVQGGGMIESAPENPLEVLANQSIPKPKYGWISCFSVNAKNSYGGYTGFKRKLAVIRDNQVIGIDSVNDCSNKNFLK